MYSDEKYGHIIRSCLIDIPTGSDDQTKVARGVGLLKSIYAVFRVETERVRVVSRTTTEAQLKTIRLHIAKVVTALDIDTAEPPPNASDAVKEAEFAKSQLLAKLCAVHTLWRVEKQDFAQDFYEFTTELVGVLKKAEDLFSHLDKIQADFDGMDEAQQSASYLPQETDTRAMRSFRHAYRGAYPYLRKYSSKTPVHLTIPLIVELYELLYGDSYGIAPNYKHNSSTKDERLFVPRWNSPGLRFAYRVIRELGMLNSFIEPKENFGSCTGDQFGPNASLSCTDADCLACRHADDLPLPISSR